MEILNQECPVCHKKTLRLIDKEYNVPYFGKISLFTMICDNCGFSKSDVESLEKKEAVRYELLIENEKDLNTKVVKSSSAKIIVPRILSIEPGIASQGYITTIEGVLNRVLYGLRLRYDAEPNKKLKNMIKKIEKVKAGHESIKVIIEDPNGNSAILSEKAVKKAIKNRDTKNKK